MHVVNLETANTLTASPIKTSYSRSSISQCSGSASTCPFGYVICGDACIPTTGTCCNDQKYYCPDFGICTSDGYCCDLGDDCVGSGSGSGSGSGATSTFGSAPTSSADDNFTFTSSASSADDTSTVTPSKPTPTSTEEEDSFTTPIFTAETTSDDNSGFTFPTLKGGDDDSSSSDPTPTISPVTVVVTASSRPTSGQAGGRYKGDGRVAAGFAVAAALLI